MRNVIRVMLPAVVLAGLCACGAGGSRSPLTQPSSTALSGTWVGTLSRPGGLPSISVRWVVTQSGTAMSGPMTLTSGTGSITFDVPGEVSGNSDAYDFVLFLTRSTRPATIPSCSLQQSLNAQAKGLRSPVTAITTDPFTLQYSECQGFMDPPPQRTGFSETTQLSITKQ
jgi:hypothetical protein